MAKHASRTPHSSDLLTPSLLERLRDQNTASAGPQVLDKIRDCVRNELEALLNTRWRCLSQDAKVSPVLAKSLVNYGLPDFLGGNLQGAQDPDAVCRAIRLAIESFEPRLKNVRVRASPETSVDRTLSLRIDAELRVESWQDRVQFNTILEPTGQVRLNYSNKS